MNVNVPNVPDRPLRPRITKLYRRAMEVGEKIETFVNESGFFITHQVKCTVYPNEGILFYLYDPTVENVEHKRAMNNEVDVYCSASLFLPSLEEYPSMHIGYVNSPIGHGTGIFMLYLQLLLGFLCNVREVTLENYADDAYRAALGIYHLFEVNMRGMNQNNFKGKTLAEQLHASEGKMRMPMHGDFVNAWVTDLRELDKKTQHQLANRPNPWNQDPPYPVHLDTFLYMLHQNFSGGARKRSSTRKQRNSRRKRSSHKTRRNKKLKK